MVNRAHGEPISPTASIEEAAAVVAAVERFERDTAPARAPERGEGDEWARTAILEGVSREEQRDLADPWINT